MGKFSRRRGITLVEVLTAIGVVLFLVIMIVAAIPRWRESARKANCANNMKQIGLGLLNYESQKKHLPGSAEVIRPELPRPGDGWNSLFKIFSTAEDIKSRAQRPVGGWSFLFKILRNMEYDTIYDNINPDEIKGTTEVVSPNKSIIVPRTSLGTAIGSDRLGLNAIAVARDTVISEFLCPSNSNIYIELPCAPITPPGQKYAITNYKAMCSAFYPGFATNTGTTQQYTGDVTVPAGSYPGLYQCDGGLYPTNDGIRLKDITDGTSHTILCGETMDYTASSWIAGSDVNMVAIPDSAPQIASGVVPVLYSDDSGSSYYALPGFNGKYYDRGGTSKIVTFFSLEYGPAGKNAGDYPLDPMAAPCQIGTHTNSPVVTNEYGPSSGHPTVINCLFADGSVRGVRKDVDASALFHAVTRNNNDPPADDHL